MIKFEELKNLLQVEIDKAEKPFKEGNKTPNQYQQGHIDGLKKALNIIIVKYL